jgi:ATP-dependent Lon protease
VAALASLLVGEPIRSDVAMTGEITLRGKVLPVGGIKEKVLAARRAGLSTVVLPDHNEKDLVEIPDEQKKDVEFEFVSSVDDVLKVALDRADRKGKRKSGKKKTGSRKGGAGRSRKAAAGY